MLFDLVFLRRSSESVTAVSMFITPHKTISPTQRHNSNSFYHMSILTSLRRRMRPGQSKPIDRQGPGKKQLSLLQPCEIPIMGGVFISASKLTQNESSAIDDGSIGSTEDSQSTQSSWKSSGSKEHNKNAPLIVPNPDLPDIAIQDEAEALGMVMARSRNLPGTWYFSSNHIMVNQERTKQTVAPVSRMRILDELARQHAEEMAAESRLFHTKATVIRECLDCNVNRLGENIARGESIRSIHGAMMRTLADKNNILDRRFTHIGMGTARGKNGELYMCQIFRG